MDASEEAIRNAFIFCKSAYKDILKNQIYLADVLNIPMSYTDKLSISELDFLLQVASDYMKEKNEASNQV